MVRQDAAGAGRRSAGGAGGAGAGAGGVGAGGCAVGAGLDSVRRQERPRGRGPVAARNAPKGHVARRRTAQEGIFRDGRRAREDRRSVTAFLPLSYWWFIIFIY